MQARFRYTPPRLLLDNALYTVILGASLAALASAAGAEAWAALARAVSPIGLFIGGLWILHLLCHWGAVGALTALERLAPAWMAERRIQPRASEEKPADFWRVIAVNHLASMPLCAAALAWALLARGERLDAPLPGIGEVLLHLALLGAVAEVGFWSVHRLLHEPAIFRAIHRVHHRFRAPSALTAPYMHPLEFSVCNMGPLIVGAALIGAHPATIAMFGAIGTLNVTFTHCGHRLPGVPWAVHHDLHHHRARGCYGTLFVLDRLTDNDRELREMHEEWRARSREGAA